MSDNAPRKELEKAVSRTMRLHTYLYKELVQGLHSSYSNTFPTVSSEQKHAVVERLP